MYNGTVTVSQHQVPSFLKEASLLKIGGNDYLSLYNLIISTLYNLCILGLSTYESNLEVNTHQPDDIGFIQARPEEQGLTILPQKDPEDVIISTQNSFIAAEPSSEMTEEEEDEEGIFLVEGLPRKRKAFRDGSLFVHQVGYVKSLTLVLLNPSMMLSIINRTIYL